MEYYIGIDGGGTKTAVTIGKSDGIPIKTIEKRGCSYKDIGILSVVKLISDSVDEITESINIKKDDLKGICIGLPCFGESPEDDKEVEKILKETFSPVPVLTVNDGVVGLAGSLELKEGVHLVSGTGAIAIGRREDGKDARSNGWSEFFSDEGSCYFIGKEAMSLFAKESDLRKPRGPLYDIVKEELNIKNDFDFIDIIEKEYVGKRDKVASFQLFAYKAALKGDKEALKLYELSAEHLADSVCAIIKQLGWEDKNIPVSYFGGLFKTGDLILNPLKEKLSNVNCTLVPPKHTAVEGALLLSIKTFN